MIATILPVSAISSHPNNERITMTSTNIYTPYCYLIGWTRHNKWYYGRRTRKGCHPSEFWKKYFTSSKHVEQFRAEYGEPDVIQIRKTFSNAKDCARWENKVLTRLNVRYNDRFLNIKNGDDDWDTTGWDNEERKRLGLSTIPGKPKGSKHSEEARKARSERLKGKPTHPNFTSSGHEVSEETRKKLSENMSKWRKGKAPPNKGISRPRCSCIVCHKEVDDHNLNRWHKHISKKGPRSLLF